MPYESIDAETYHDMKSGLGKLSFGRIKGEEVVIERFCDNDVCEIDFVAPESTSVEDDASEIAEVITEAVSQTAEAVASEEAAE